MVGISLFGTCTMKYNPRVNERLAARAEVAEIHPHQDDATVQGLLEIVHRIDLIAARAVRDGPLRLPGRRRCRRGVPARRA